MKKHLFVLTILAALLICSPTVIYADYNCNCQGDFEIFDGYKNPFTWFAITHTVNDDGNLVDCQQSSFSRPALGDEFYMVRLTTPDYLYYHRISISINDEFEYYDSDGNFYKITYSEQQNSGTAGYCNEKFYGTTGALAKLYCEWDESYVDNIDFNITSDDYLDAVNKLDELAQYLCGGRSDLPDGVSSQDRQPVYDLEPPLDVKVLRGSWQETNSRFQVGYQYDMEPYKLWWNQSNIDLSDFYTEIYIKQNGSCREKKIFGAGPWTAFDSGWVFKDSVLTYDYCNKSNHPYSIRVLPFSMYKNLEMHGNETDGFPNDYLYSKCPDGYQYEIKSMDYLLRNTQVINDLTRYSNWIWVHMYDDGTYSVTELQHDYSPDLSDPSSPDPDPDEPVNPDDPAEPSVPEVPTTTPDPSPDYVVPDSPYYPNGGSQYPVYQPSDDSTPPGLEGVNNVSTFLKVLTDLAKSLGSFPSLFAQIFQFLPIWVISIVGCLFVVILLRGIF